MATAKKKTPKEPTLVERFGSRVKQRRVDLKLSQQALAERADLSVSYVSMLERALRDPPLSTVELVAKGLDCAPTFLMV